MRLRAIGDLVAHAGLEDVVSSILQLRGQFALNAEENVALVAPMVGLVARRILQQAHADVAELAGPPVRPSRALRVFFPAVFAPSSSFRTGCL